MRKKTLWAIAMASSLLNPPLVLGADSSNNVDDMETQIAKNTNVSPEWRAYDLLSLASNYIKGRSKADVRMQFKNMEVLAASRYAKNMVAHTDALLKFSAYQASENPDVEFIFDEQKHKTDGISPENRRLATSSVNAAWRLIGEKTRTNDIRLAVIAFKLYQALGDVEGLKKCDKFLMKDTVEWCEGLARPEATEIIPAMTVLNTMAEALAPVAISDLPPPTKSLETPALPEPSAAALHASEKLRLRALKLADRLGKDNYARRMAHRNLALWYQAQGKTPEFDQQKNELFDLIGVSDDRLLYGVSVGCAVSFFVLDPKDSVDCGRG